jgi:hypothetical protein
MNNEKLNNSPLENRNQSDERKRFAKLRQFVDRHHIAILLICGAILIFLGSSIAFLITHQSPSHDNQTNLTVKKKPQPAKKYYSPLTGLEVADETATKQAVTGVMIENSPEARPQSGLKQAGVVYEAVAEGGITRFLALYQGDKPNLIGPVRSLRMYYLGWASAYQASIAHVGGSYNALSEVRNGNYRDIDQWFNSGSYWRASDRYAPHNVYTSGEKLNQLNNAKGYKTSEFSSFPRTDGKSSENLTATTVNINFSSALFNTSYTYSKDTNSYLRSLAGAPHNDRESGQIAPNVVIAMEVGLQRRNNLDHYEDAITTGSGKAYIFQNGTITEATWSRESFTSPLKLIGADGKEVALNRGQTWISAFTPGRGSVSWQ